MDSVGIKDSHILVMLAAIVALLAITGIVLTTQRGAFTAKSSVDKIFAGQATACIPGQTKCDGKTSIFFCNGAGQFIPTDCPTGTTCSTRNGRDSC